VKACDLSFTGTPKEHPVEGDSSEAGMAGDVRYEAVRQYSLAQILGVWAAAAIPMGLLAWVFAPLLRDQLGGDEPLGQALLILLTVGLVWQFVLVLILVKRELGTLEWPRVRDALWLRAPRNPKTGSVGGRVWWWAVLFVLLFGIWSLVPTIPGPSVRDFADFIGTDRGEDFFRGAWGWYAVLVILVVFNTVLGEELLFRGLLLPRMRDACGKWDWVVNGALFALYHLHQPWDIPNSFIDGIFLEAYPSRRFQSAWMGIIVHSTASVFALIAVLTLVA
jgi:membrane protease YdiL (CAAX protease family)